MVPHPIEGAAADIVHPGIDDILVLSFDYTLLLHFLILLLRDMEVVERKLDVLEGMLIGVFSLVIVRRTRCFFVLLNFNVRRLSLIFPSVCQRPDNAGRPMSASSLLTHNQCRNNHATNLFVQSVGLAAVQAGDT